jgi:hypothetical protein
MHVVFQSIDIRYAVYAVHALAGLICLSRLGIQGEFQPTLSAPHIQTCHHVAIVPWFNLPDAGSIQSKTLCAWIVGSPGLERLAVRA